MKSRGGGAERPRRPAAPGTAQAGRLADCRAVSFDACDTVLCSLPPLPRRVHAECQAMGITASLADVEAAFHAASDRLAEEAVRRWREGRTLAPGEGFAIWREAFRAGPRWPHVAPEAFEDLERRLIGVQSYAAARPGAAAVMRAVRASGRRVAITSNYDETLEDVLARVGLREHVDVVIASAAVGVEKPDPAVFRFTLEALGTTAHETVHVGDHAFDVIAASGAGLRTVWLREWGEAKLEGLAPDAVIARLEDLLPLLGLSACDSVV